MAKHSVVTGDNEDEHLEKQEYIKDNYNPHDELKETAKKDEDLQDTVGQKHEEDLNYPHEQEILETANAEDNIVDDGGHTSQTAEMFLESGPEQKSQDQMDEMETTRIDKSTFDDNFSNMNATNELCEETAKRNAMIANTNENEFVEATIQEKVHEDPTDSIRKEKNQNMTNDIDMVQEEMESENSEKDSQLASEEHQHNKLSGSEAAYIDPLAGDNSTHKEFGDLCTSQASKEENTHKENDPEDANEDISALSNDYEGHKTNAGVAEVVVEKEIHQRTEEQRCKQDETAAGMSLLHDDKIQREKTDTRSELEASEFPTISVDPEICFNETTTDEASLEVVGSEDKIGNPSDVVSEKTILDETSVSTQDVEEMDLLEKQKESFLEKAEVIMLPTIGSEDKIINPSDVVSETIMAETSTSTQDVEKMDHLEKQEESSHEKAEVSMLQIVGSEDKVENPSDVVSEKTIMAETIASNQDAEEMDLLGKQEESFQEKTEVAMLLECAVARMGTDNPSYKADGASMEDLTDETVPANREDDNTEEDVDDLPVAQESSEKTIPKGEMQESSITSTSQDLNHDAGDNLHQQTCESEPENLMNNSELISEGPSSKTVAEAEVTNTEPFRSGVKVHTTVSSPSISQATNREDIEEAMGHKEPIEESVEVVDNNEDHDRHTFEAIIEVVGENMIHEDSKIFDDTNPEDGENDKNTAGVSSMEQLEGEEVSEGNEPEKEKDSRVLAVDSHICRDKSKTEEIPYCILDKEKHETENDPNLVFETIIKAKHSVVTGDNEDEPLEKREYVKDNYNPHDKLIETVKKDEDLQNTVGQKHEEDLNYPHERELFETANAEDDIVDDRGRTTQTAEVVLESGPEQKSQDQMDEMKTTRIDKSTFDDNFSNMYINDEEGENQEEFLKDLNSTYAEQTYGTINISNKNERELSQKLEFVSKSAEDEDQGINKGKEASKIKNSLADGSLKRTIPETLEPSDLNENVKDETTQDKHNGKNHDRCLLVEDIVHSAITGKHTEDQSSACEEQTYQSTNLEGIIQGDVKEDEKDTEKLGIPSGSLIEIKGQEDIGESVFTEMDVSIDNENSKMIHGVAEQVKDEENLSKAIEESQTPDSHALVLPRPSESNDEKYEESSKSVFEEQCHQTTTVGEKTETSVHKERTVSESLQIIEEKVEIPEIVVHSADSQTVKGKGEDTLEEDISNIPNTGELLQKTTHNGIGEDHEYDNNITSTEDTIITDIDKEKEKNDQLDTEYENSEKASGLVSEEHQHNKISGLEAAYIDPLAGDNSTNKAFGDLCTSQAPEEEYTQKATNPEKANEDISALNNDYEGHDKNAGVAEVVVEKEIHQSTEEQRCKEDETTAGMSLLHDDKIQSEQTDTKSELEASESPTISVDPEICLNESTIDQASLEVVGSEDKIENPSDVVSEKTTVDETSISTQDVVKMDLLEKQKESFQEKAEVIMLPIIGSEDKIRNPSDVVSETIMAETSTSTQDVEKMELLEKQEESFHEKAEVSMLQIVGSEDKVENPSDVVSEKTIMAETIASNQDAKEIDLLGKQESFQEKAEVTMLLEHAVARMGTDNPSYKADGASLEYINDAEGEKQEESLKDLNCKWAEQTYGTTNISNKIEREPSQKLEFISKSAPEDKDQGTNMEKEACKIKNSLDDGSLERTIPETIEPCDFNENAKGETTQEKHIGNNHDSHLLVEEIVHTTINEKHTEGQNSAYEEQTYQTTNLEGIIQDDVSEEKTDTEKLGISSGSLIEIKGQEEIGESVFTKMDSSIDDENSKMIHGVGEQVKDDENLSKAIEESQSPNSHALVFLARPSEPNDEKYEESSKSVFEEQYHQTTNVGEKTEADVHKERTDPESLQIIEEKVEIPEIVAHSDDSHTVRVKGGDALEEDISNIPNSGELVEKATDNGVGEDHEYDNNITNSEDTIITDINKEKANINQLDIESDLGPEDHSHVMLVDKESFKVEEAPSLQNDTQNSTVNDPESGSRVEKNVKEMAYELKNDEILEHASVCKNIDEDVQKKEEPLNNFMEKSVSSERANCAEADSGRKMLDEAAKDAKSVVEVSKIESAAQKSESSEEMKPDKIQLPDYGSQTLNANVQEDQSYTTRRNNNDRDILELIIMDENTKNKDDNTNKILDSSPITSGLADEAHRNLHGDWDGSTIKVDCSKDEIPNQEVDSELRSIEQNREVRKETNPIKNHSFITQYEEPEAVDLNNEQGIANSNDNDKTPVFTAFDEEAREEVQKKHEKPPESSYEDQIDEGHIKSIYLASLKEQEKIVELERDSFTISSEQNDNELIRTDVLQNDQMEANSSANRIATPMEGDDHCHDGMEVSEVVGNSLQDEAKLNYGNVSGLSMQSQGMGGDEFNIASVEKIEKLESARKEENMMDQEAWDITANEQFQEAENESKKDKEPEANWKPEITNSTSKAEVEIHDSKLAQIGLSEKTEEALPINDEDLIKSLRASSPVENAKQEIAEKFDKIYDYKPIECTEQAYDDNELGIELPKDKGSTAECPAQIEKFMHIAGDTASVPEIHVNDGKVPDAIPRVLSVSEPSGQDTVVKEDSVNPTEFSNLQSDEEDRKNSSLVEVTGSKEISHKISAMPDPELHRPEEEKDRVQLEEDASCEAVEFNDLQNEKKKQAEGNYLPVSRLLMDRILREEKVEPDKACDVEAEDNTLHDGGEQHDAGIYKEERISVIDETSISRHSVGPDELQTTSEKFKSENKIHEKLDDPNGAKIQKEEILVSFSPEEATGKTSISEDNVGQEQLEISTFLVEENHICTANEKTEIPAVKDEVKEKNSPHDSSPTMTMGEDVKDGAPSLTEISACGVENDSRESTLTEKESTENKMDIEDCIHPTSAQNEKVQGIVLEKYPKEQTNKKNDEVLDRDVHLPLVLKTSHEDNLLEEGSREGKAILQDVQKRDKASYEVSEAQYPSNAESVGETKSLVHSKETLPNPKYDQNGKSSSNLKDDLHGQTSEIESEVKMVENEDENHDDFTENQVPHEKNKSRGKAYLSELQEVDQPNLAVKSTDQNLEVGKNLLDGKILAVHTDEQDAVGITEAQADEDNSEGEKDEYKPEESGHDARVVVEARDADLKPAHKKSHNILSGVGSKVKHSLSKVKKAIIGKSSHSKTSPAK